MQGNPLYAVPGLGGYLARKGMIQDEGMDELKQAGAVLSLQGAIQNQAKAQQAQQREQAYRAAIEGLGPNPTQEGLAAVASKFAAPDDVMRTHQSSLDRQATRDAAATQAEAQRQARLHERQLVLEAAAQNTALAREARLEAAAQAADLRRELQENQQRFQASQTQSQQAFQRQLAGEARANRQPQVVQTADGPMVLNGTQATPVTGPGGVPVRGPKVDKPMTEFQGKAALYGTRAAQSHRVLEDIEDTISLEGLATKQAGARIPVIGGIVGAAGNAMLSKNQQKVEQAQRDFVNAVLRQESGAVISDAEFENARKQYFPAPGDSKEVRDQKRANRMLAINGFARMAGSGADDIQTILKEPRMPAQNPAAPYSDAEKERRYQEWKARQGK